MLSDNFLTITGPSEGLFKDKGSKFLSYAYPVKSEEEIKVLLATIRKEHFSARHCCFAWCLGTEEGKFRVNDDGEPSGTAGRPIYGQIQSFKLTNILVVVVRYFGGTLLGVSGLIQAYKKAALDAINHSEIITGTIEHLLEVHFEYNAMNDLMQLIKEEQLEIVESQFDMQSIIRLKVRSAKLEMVKMKTDKIEGVISQNILQD
ncbi:MAG TPA: YigZ family protein [Prolixibacteraceae bacterium]